MGQLDRQRTCVLAIQCGGWNHRRESPVRGFIREPPCRGLWERIAFVVMEDYLGSSPARKLPAAPGAPSDRVPPGQIVGPLSGDPAQVSGSAVDDHFTVVQDEIIVTRLSTSGG